MSHADLALAYLGLDVPDVGAWHDYATSVIGLAPATSRPAGDDTALLKADERLWRVALHEGERPGLRYAGFEAASEGAYEAAVQRAAGTGVALHEGDAGECAARGVRALTALVDPSGVRIELCWGPTIEAPFVSPVGVPRFVTGALGLGHYVVLTPDLDASFEFYLGALGLRLTDYVRLGEGMSVQFLRCNARHHSVALTAVGPMSGLHHIAFEVDDIDQVGYAAERAIAAGAAITASIGRHRNDRMLSFYMRSPAGFEVEIGCTPRLIDEHTWVANEFTGGDEWGHHGLTGDSLAASVEAR